MYYPLTKSDKKLRNYTEAVALAFYATGIVIFAITGYPACMLMTTLSVPVCMYKRKVRLK